VKNITDDHAFSIGRKCPRCGSSQVGEPQEESGDSVRHIPGISRQICQQCGQAFTMYWGVGVLHERRHLERVPTENTLLARFRGKKPVFARIDDISTEGIGVICPQEQQDLLWRGFAIDLYDCMEGTTLEGLPIEVVSSVQQEPNAAGQTQKTVKIGARFLHLTTTQKKLLDHFISKNSLSNQEPAETSSQQ